MQTTTSCRKALSAFGLPVFATEALSLSLPVSLFLSLTPPTFTFSLSRLSLSTSRLPPLFSLEHSSHFQKSKSEQKSRDGRPSLIGVPAGTGATQYRCTALEFHRFWDHGGSGATSPTVPAHVPPQLPSSSPSLPVLRTNLK